MKNIFEVLENKELVTPPKWLIPNIHYLVYTGSVSYGVSNDTSDLDIIGWAIPPKTDIFPHLRGEIPGFGRQNQRFAQWQEHHIKDGEQEYDFTVYSIVKYFQLVMENNPNMLDSLAVPQRCVLFCSPIAQMVRDNRHMFFHKGSYHKFRGYSYSQKSKLANKNKEVERKMPEHIKKILGKIDNKDLKNLEQEKKNRGLYG